MDIVTGNYAAVRRGTIITNLELFRIDGETTPAFSVPQALVVRSKQSGEIRGRVEWQAEIHSRGTYTYNDPA
jgi:hypothetical protein